MHYSIVDLTKCQSLILFSEVNTSENLSDRLKGFVLEAFDVKTNQDQVYIDKGPTLAIYNIDFEKIITVSALRIKQTNIHLYFDQTPVLSLCEIEAFGGR